MNVHAASHVSPYNYSVGVAKLSIARGYCECAIGEGLVSVIQSSGVSAIQGFLMY